jgi:site-specific DNA-methyltransferase (adenine-specific)
MANNPSKSAFFEINKIYEAEALESLIKMPNKSIDLAFIDPPYNSGADFGISKDNMPEREYADFMKEVVQQCLRVSKRGLVAYLDWKNFSLFWHEILPQAEPIILYKHIGNTLLSDLGITQCHRAILTTAKALQPVKSFWDDIETSSDIKQDKEQIFKHPAQTPYEAIERIIITFSEEDETILDPFMGCGTTAVAAKCLNRNYIGFELNKEYIKTANNRIRSIDEDKC